MQDATYDLLHLTASQLANGFFAKPKLGLGLWGHEFNILWGLRSFENRGANARSTAQRQKLTDVTRASKNRQMTWNLFDSHDERAYRKRLSQPTFPPRGR